MRVLFVGRSYAQLPYYESVLRALLAAGHEVHYWYDRAWSRNWGDDTALKAFHAAHPEFHVAEAPRRRGWLRKLAMGLREWRAYGWYLTTMRRQSGFYARRWEESLPVSLKRLLALPGGHGMLRAISANPLTCSLLSGLINALPPDRHIKRTVKQLAPDVVAVSPGNLRYSEEGEYLRAAKSLGIPTVVPVYSWDNLTTKGIFNEQPDWLLAWNETQHREAVAYHGFSPERVVITGAPFFDKWFDQANASDTAQPVPDSPPVQPPYILYFGSSANIAKDETGAIKAWLQDLRTQPGLSDLGVLIRPHPANTQPFEVAKTELEADPRVRVAMPGRFPDNPQALAELQATCRQALAAMAINTSAMIDAVALDTPVVSIRWPEFSATQDAALHFQTLAQSGALTICENNQSALQTLIDLQAGNDLTQPGRQAFIRHYLRPLQVLAGTAVALALEAIAAGQPPEAALRKFETPSLSDGAENTAEPATSTLAPASTI